MILYKYVKSDGIDIIKKLRLKVCDAASFNDPFELLPSIVDVSQQEILRAVTQNEEYMRRLYDMGILEKRVNVSFDEFKKRAQSKEFISSFIGRLNLSFRNISIKLRRQTGEVFLITSFCAESKKKQDEILMWSHYAEGHLGLRIAFESKYLEINDAALIKMNYEVKRLKLRPIDYWLGGKKVLEQTIEKMLQVKSSAWLYENEYRLLVSPRVCDFISGNAFFPIDRRAILRVDCGLRSTKEIILEIKNLVSGNLGSNVPVRKAEIDEHEFKMKYVEC